MGGLGKDIYTVIVLALIGSILIGVMTHANGFKVAFGSVGDFFLNVMNGVKG